ncbi:MAG: hypothetical protein V5A64_06845 [Candidatus Thermoplasmatota archaeon]
MKKSIFVLAVVLFISVTVLCGCYEPEEESEEDKFVGKWVMEDSFRAYEFLENGTCYINDYRKVGTYEVNKTERRLVIHQKNPSVTYTYTYSFNYAYDRLTLTNEEKGVSRIFKKQ